MFHLTKRAQVPKIPKRRLFGLWTPPADGWSREFLLQGEIVSQAEIELKTR
jgi:hypothetical protein